MSQDGRQLNATGKVLAVLEEVSRGRGASQLGDIAARTGLVKTSTHRLLADLVELGFVVSDGRGGYASGPRLEALASGVTARRRPDVRAVLADLQRTVNQTVHFALRAGSEAIYVNKIEPQRPYQMASQIGTRVCLYSTASGKSILAHLPADELAHYLATTRLTARTPNTLATKKAIRAELAQIRKQGYALDDEENEPSIRCIGAPVFDASGTVIGGISVSTLAVVMSRSQATAMAPDVIAAASAVSQTYADATHVRA